MSRNQTLELLTELIDTLTGMQDVEPGQPLRAANWNTLVEGVVTMARLVESRERTTSDALDKAFAPRDHLHTGKVDLTWFEPETRAMLEGRRIGPEVQNALTEMRRELTGMRKQVDTLQDEMDKVRLELYGLRDRDDARDKAVSRLDLRFESVRDLEERVTNVDQRFDLVGKRVDEALAFRDTLEGVDLRSLQDRVEGVESLRDNLLTAAGQVVEIRDFEQRLTRLESDTVKAQDLDDELASRIEEGGFLDETELAASLTLQMDERYNPRFDELLASDQTLSQDLLRIDNDLSGQSELLASVNTRVTTLEPVLDVTNELNVRVEQLDGQVAELNDTVSVHDGALRDIGALEVRVAGLEDDVKALDGVTGSITELNQRVSGVEERVAPMDQLTSTVSSLDERVKSVEGLRPRLDEIDQRVGDLERNRLSTLEERVVATEVQLDDLTTVKPTLDELSKSQKALEAWRLTTGTRIDTLERQLKEQAPLVRELDTLDQRTTLLQKEVTELEQVTATQTETLSGLATIPDQVSKLEGASSSLSTRVNQTQRQVKLLDGRVTTTESQVGELSNAGFVDASTFKRFTSRLGEVETRVGSLERGGVLRPTPISPTPIVTSPITPIRSPLGPTEPPDEPRGG
ncbi:hypothetical protein [Haliangium sp.]|uniref:hypothetical protein n=1 Tax=Haliangium sp. TaxID=2663208 RepID=UPI003D0A6552